MFKNLLPVPKIYSARDINYKFSVLAVNFATQLQFITVCVRNSHSIILAKEHIAYRYNIQILFITNRRKPSSGRLSSKRAPRVHRTAKVY